MADPVDARAPARPGGVGLTRQIIEPGVFVTRGPAVRDRPACPAPLLDRTVKRQ